MDSHNVGSSTLSVI